MKKTLVALVFLVLPSLTLAAAGGFALHPAPIDLRDQASLQRGAKLFVNYCMGCHSLEHQRYNRLARDIGLTEEQVQQNLIFTGSVVQTPQSVTWTPTKIGETMRNAMPKRAAKQWFGVTPPDLSLIARARGVNYLYTYMLTFYEDPTRPFGVNNAVFPNAGMPHVLWDLQGMQKPVYTTHQNAEGQEVKTLTGFELSRPGSMSASEYRAAMGDLVNFLSYVGEPIQLKRQQVGIWVLLFLLIAFGAFYALKKEYWKDVH